MGYEQSIASQISQLRTVLHDYQGFAVFRELLQNADDAGATRLDLGWVRGLAGAGNELLAAAPAVFIVNNGEFTARNARSIAQLGLSDKAGEHGPIGKFGLGLKSIHHLGEIYFYLSPSTFEGSRYKPNDVQNPWTARRRDGGNHPSQDGGFEEAESFRPEWDRFDESDQDRIRQRLVPVLEAAREGRDPLLHSAPWFCLWVPLRRREDVGDEVDPITPRYTGDEASPHPGIFPPDFEVGMARLVPFLRHIREVRCWVENPEGLLRPVSGLKVDADCRRAAVQFDGPGLRPLAGRVRVDRFEDPRPTTLVFTGFEALLDDPRFGELSRRADWPRPLTLPTARVDRGQSLAKPEPALAHAAACFVSQTSESRAGRLDITWASYLPVQLPKVPSLDLQSPHHITLTLHGRFFVDAGRVAIDFGEGLPPESQSLRQSWNDLLRDEGTLNLVLPALQSFEGSLVAEERAAVLRDLTEGFRSSSFFVEHRASICRSRQWAYRHSQSGPGWALVGADAMICRVPEPVEGGPPLDAVFPNLGELCRDDFCVIYEGWPSLLEEDREAPWPEWAALRLLEVDAACVFADPGRLALFTRTIEVALVGTESGPVFDRLREIIRQGMASLKLEGVMRQRDLIRRCLDLLPPEVRLRVDLGTIPDAVAGRLIEPLWEAEGPVLVVPIGPGSASPAPDVRRRLVDLLLSVAPFGPEADFFEHRVLIACQVVGLDRPGAATPWEGISELPIFPVEAGYEGGPKLVGRATLTEALGAGRLVVDGSGLGGPLRRALLRSPGVEFLAIPRRIADATFGHRVVRDCDPAYCRTLLEARPPLVQDEQARGVLLRDLLVALRPADLPAAGPSLRYLLHASPEHFVDDAPLSYKSDTSLAPAWESLASLALRQSGGGWRVVPLALAERLNRTQREWLALVPLERPWIVDLARSVRPASLDLSGVTDDEARALIEECKPADFDVIRALPIHRTTDGRRVSIDDHCRWRADFPIDGDLAESIVVLEPDARPAVAFKQKEIHPHSLDAKGVIDLILRTPAPHLHGKTVLRAISSLGTIPSHLSTALKTTRWIETKAGRIVSPQQVIDSRTMNESIRDALADARIAEPEVASVLDLPDAFLSSRVASGLFPPLGDALERLGQALALDDRYRIGPLRRDEVSLAGLRSSFADAPGEVMPCFALLRTREKIGAIRENLDAAIEGRLLPSLLREISAARISAILWHLAGRHAEAPLGEQALFLEWYRHYLKVARGSEQVAEILAEIPLLSAAGGWKEASALTTASIGVEPSCLLDPGLSRMLGEAVHRAGEAANPSPGVDLSDRQSSCSLDSELRLGVAALRTYAEAWASVPSVPRELVGGLIALLGDDPNMRDLAAEFLGNFEVESLRDGLRWDSTPPRYDGGTLVGGAGVNIHLMMKLRRVVVELSDDTKVRVKNLLGRDIDVPVRQGFEDLLLPHETIGEHGDLSCHRVRLRRVDPERLPDGLDPVALLRETARRLLEVVDRQSIPNFDEVWGKLARSEQLDLQIAQRCLQDGLPTVLNGLGLRHSESLGKDLRDWHDANRKLAQIEGGEDGRRDEAEERKRKARDRLRRLLEIDPVAQADGLEAVREEILRSQYMPSSIPFELFQNADDAVGELRILHQHARPLDPSSSRFVVDADGDSLWFLSWGRAINRHQAAGFDGSDRGFDQDLEKMLTLGRSDKGRAGMGDEPSTGKFGLGFKSVLLATKRPRVLSGRLAFEVLGGLFPGALVEGREALAGRLKEFGQDARDGTIVELPLDEVTPGEVLGRFERLVPLLVVFGREIRSCTIRSGNGRAESYRWEGAAPGTVSGVEVGALPGPEGGRLLVLRGRTSAIALGLGQAGLLALPAGWPTFWVTAPTGEEEKLGFAVNAPFDLDKGRSKLAYSSRRNQEVAAQVGRELGEVLVALHRESEADWEGLRAALGLRDGTTALSFWESFWDRLGSPLAVHHDPHGPLLRAMFWEAPDRAIGRLVSECDALPNGLWGDGRGLTRIRDLRASLSGLLDSEEVFAGVALWPSFDAGSNSRKLISGRILAHLGKLATGLVPDCVELTLAGAVAAELGTGREAGPPVAARLGTLISPGFLRHQAERGATARREVEALIEGLANVRFLALDGGWHPAKDLLVARPDDEGLRAAIAPARFVLSGDYVGTGEEFFLACRKQLRAEAQQVREWAIEAADGKRRRAALDYLLRGELGRSVAEQLTGRIEETWLGRLDDSQILGYRFSHNDASVILGRLGLSRPVAAPLPPPPPPPPRVTIEKIYAWWEEKRLDQIRRYEERWYPQGKPPLLVEDITRRSPPEDREGWMVLFMLGAMHTLGRARAESHRNFLANCKADGSLRVFSSPTDDLAAWMQVLQTYFDGTVSDSPYLHWMGRFASLFQLAHWLPVYVDSFQAIDHYKKDFELESITAPRASADLQGGGFDAPPVTRTLGIGACFVVRELVRSGMITNSRAHRHCYVPSARVRRLMTILGCPGLADGRSSAAERVRASSLIHDYLVSTLGDEAKARFHGDFDLPLTALTERSNRAKLFEIMGTGPVEDWDEVDDESLEMF
jgi:hypothetical protein